MKKIKITQEQYNKLIEESIVSGGINRVNKQFVKTTQKADIQTLDSSIQEDDEFNIKKPLGQQSGLSDVPNSRMKNRREFSVNEDILSPETHQQIHNIIQYIWNNPSQKGLDAFFIRNGINWGDIATYLTSVGVLDDLSDGNYKIKNFFNKKFSKNEKVKAEEKQKEIEKIVNFIEKDKNSPWSQETTYQKKQKMQAKPDSEWKATPKPFNPNRFSTGLEEDKFDNKVPKTPNKYKPIYMNYDILLVQGPDGMYVFYYENINREDMPNPEYQLDMDDVAEYLNTHSSELKTGEGVEAWEGGEAQLIKLDNELKTLLLTLYSKDNGLASALQNLSEMTSAASVGGSFVGPAGGGYSDGAISPGNTPAKQLNSIINDEDKIYGGKIEEEAAVNNFSYVQPAIWAKDKANWAGDKRTQYPKGQFVTFDPCTKLNNNKEAQKGKCSQGAVDNVVKLRTTKDSVISKDIYAEVAKKTGKTVEEVKKIIENNVK